MSEQEFRVSRVRPGVYLCRFKTQRELALSFLRLQEHYECPHFRGKIFTLKEFRAWYQKERGCFSYAQDWAGFNIPGRILAPFTDGRFKSPSLREQRLLAAIKKAVARHQDPDDLSSYYIIGVFGNGTANGALRHEMAHALFSINPAYRKKVLRVISRVEGVGGLERLILGLGYNRSSLIDEMHAYLAVDSKDLEEGGLDLTPYRRAIRALGKLLDEHL